MIFVWIQFGETPPSCVFMCTNMIEPIACWCLCCWSLLSVLPAISCNYPTTELAFVATPKWLVPGMIDCSVLPHHVFLPVPVCSRHVVEPSVKEPRQWTFGWASWEWVSRCISQIRHVFLHFCGVNECVPSFQAWDSPGSYAWAVIQFFVGQPSGILGLSRPQPTSVCPKLSASISIYGNSRENEAWTLVNLGGKWKIPISWRTKPTCTVAKELLVDDSRGL